MTDVPIIFSAPMVLALLDGRKTMTRRLARKRTLRPKGNALATTPWCQRRPGDRLWVKEGWRWNVDYHTPAYRADYPEGDGLPDSFYRWRSPLHMARKDSRLTLIVTATKIERLQDITESDAFAEGVERRAERDYRIGKDVVATDAIGCFSALWWSLYGIGAWDANPEVVALTFSVEKRNIDAKESLR